MQVDREGFIRINLGQPPKELIWLRVVYYSTQTLGHVVANPSEQITTSIDKDIIQLIDSDDKEVVVSKPASIPSQMTDTYEFLARPVKIFSQTWSEGSFLSVNCKPFSLVLANPAYKNRFAGFRFARFSVRLHFLINSSPYHYGLAIAAWKPLGTMFRNAPNDLVSQNNVTGPDVYGTPASNDFKITMMAMSNLPHVELDPMTSDGGSLTLPFLSPYQWLRLSSASTDGDNMGTLYLQSYGVLRVASAATSQTTRITCYATLHDVDFNGPSYIPQSSQSEIPLTTLKRLMIQQTNRERSTPDISLSDKLRQEIAAVQYSTQSVSKPLALASAALGAASSLFEAVGLTVTPIKDRKVVTTLTLPGISSCEGEVPMESLTLSGHAPSCDLTRLSLGSESDMDIAKIAAIPTYVQSADWAYSDGIDTVLMAGNCSPEISARKSITGLRSGVTGAIQMTPACHLSTLFAKWRGTFCLRIKVVSSQFHRGRLRFAFDSCVKPTNVVEGLTVQRIMDISECTDMTVKIPFMGRTESLALSQVFYSAALSGSDMSNIGLSTSYDQNYNSGSWTVSVLNDLTGPGAASTGVYVLFFSWMEDMEFFDPCEPLISSISYFDHYNTQSAKEPTPDKDKQIMLLPPRGPIDMTQFYGESIKSIRSLVKRTNLLCPLDFLANTNSGLMYGGCYTWYLPRFPMSYGPVRPYNTTNTTGEVVTMNWGLGYMHKTAVLATVAKTYFYNYVRNSPLTWMTPCYIGRVGSIIWRVTTTEGSVVHPVGNTWTGNSTHIGNKISDVMISRSHNTSKGYYLNKHAGTGETAFQNARIKLLSTWGSHTGSTYNTVPNAISAEVPMFSQFAFQSTSVDPTLNNDDLDYPDDAIEITATVPTVCDASSFSFTGMNLYVAGGSDFNLLGYLFPPTVYIVQGSSTVPAASTSTS